MQDEMDTSYYEKVLRIKKVQDTYDEMIVRQPHKKGLILAEKEKFTIMIEDALTRWEQRAIEKYYGVDHDR